MTNHPFSDTNWTLIGDLQGDDETRRQAAISSLVEMYMGPVYAFLRGLGCGREQATELTQAFFVKKVLEGELFKKADRKRARLRLLIQKSLENFRIDEHRRQKVRGIAIPVEQIDREEHVLPRRSTISPEDAFQRRWASSVLEEALRRCQRQLCESNRERQWQAFHARTVRPLVSGAKPAPLAVVADELGFKAPGDVANAVFDARRRMRVFLHEVVAETVSDPELIPQELEDVMRILEGGA